MIMKIFKSDRFKSLLLGQLISILITGTGVNSEFLAQRLGVSIPTAQSTLVYLMLFIIYSLFHFKSFKEFLNSIKDKCHIYLPLAVFDVEANYLVVKAYQYTSITSAMLINCFTIPVVVVLTVVFLKAKYNWRHIVGVLLCLCGIGILIFYDAITNNSSNGGPNPIVGDILCLIGATFYGISNVGQETFVKQWEHTEYLAMLGFFGTILNGIQLGVLENGELKTMKWNFYTIGLILSFSMFLFMMYSIAPFVLKMSGSTMLNLSLLTSDAYAILFGVFLFGKKLTYLYFISLVVIIGGLLMYSIKNSKVVDKFTPVDPKDNEENGILNVNEDIDDSNNVEN